MEKKLKIFLTESNRPRVEAALAEAQKGCRVRCVTVDTVYAWARRISETYSLISMRAQKGITVTVNPAHERVAKAYRGIPMSTFFVVQRFPGGWALTDVYRASCEKPQTRATLPAEAQEALIRAYEVI